ncbi:extracellular solute-binding protein [Vibrio splendidus]|uniref:ABC transporter substrate-binding protein n=1 Tax=Vibrio splendidus TaxID=29497 RepID=UPI001FB4B3BA|nr:extracellular solute-binding protein [Vibrio splendidus]UOE82412.1 extracellular solute-binding protein [Vibrio splendidus]
MKRTLSLLAICTGAILSAPSYAACDLGDLEAEGKISLLSNSYPVLKHFSDKMKECETSKLEIKNKLVGGSAVQEQARIVLSSRRGNSPYDVIQVSAQSYHEFLLKEQIQPITDLVEKYWDEYNLADIPPSIWDLARHDGEIYALPIQLNMQEFFYRQDLFDQHNLEVPHTYQEVVTTGQALQKAGIDYPLSQAMGKGWNLATEFTNIYLSLGGQYFDKDGKPLFDGEKGIEAANILKSLLPLMSPNALSLSNDLVMVNFQQDKAAMGNVWATRASEMDNDQVSKVVGKVNYSMAPTANKNTTIPATSIFWDGYVFPHRLNSDRELVFKIMMESMSKENMKKGAELAFLSRQSANQVEGEQYRYLGALAEMIERGAKPFPSEGYYGLAHTEIGNKLPDALRGRTSIEVALNEAAEGYYKEARAQGYID